MMISDHKKALSLLTLKVHKAQNIYKFFGEGDKILIGVSGGKDSLLLLEIIGELCQNPRYKLKIMPVHVKINDIGYQTDLVSINKICDSYGFNLRVIESTINFDPRHKKGACFVCSWHRRKILFATSKELGCNKIALGHHMDDAVQTLLLNMIYHGSVSSMPAKLSMFQGTLELIRPLLFLNEKEIIQYKQIRNYPELIKDCPYGESTKRNKMKILIEELETIHPSAKQNIFKAMSKIYTSYLPEGELGIINGLNEIHPPKQQS